jgi:predicted protein tyrosine phosphatase
MATYILNKYTITKFAPNPNLYNVLIRITNPGEEFLPLENRSSYRDIIELYFFDFTDEKLGLKIFQPFHMDKIISFFKEHRLCDNMVIHCDVGISRSAGVAIGWLLFKDDRASIYKIYHNRKHIPNRLIVERFAKRLNKSMKYIDKWEKEKFESVKNEMAGNNKNNEDEKNKNSKKSKSKKKKTKKKKDTN